MNVKGSSCARLLILGLHLACGEHGLRVDHGLFGPRVLRHVHQRIPAAFPQRPQDPRSLQSKSASNLLLLHRSPTDLRPPSPKTALMRLLKTASRQPSWDYSSIRVREIRTSEDYQCSLFKVLYSKPVCKWNSHRGIQKRLIFVIALFQFLVHYFEGVHTTPPHILSWGGLFQKVRLNGSVLFYIPMMGDDKCY